MITEKVFIEIDKIAKQIDLRCYTFHWFKTENRKRYTKNPSFQDLLDRKKEDCENDRCVTCNVEIKTFDECKKPEKSGLFVVDHLQFW